MSNDAPTEEIPIEFTLITNDNGPVNKYITLKPDGTLKKVSGGDIWSGQAKRICLPDWRYMAEFLPLLQSNQAITLGTLRPELGDMAYLTVQANKQELALPGRFARTRENLLYVPGKPALCAIDFDTGGMPERVKQNIAHHGGLLGAIEYVCPAFGGSAYLSRGSASSGLTIVETGEYFEGGSHHLVVLSDGSQSRQFIEGMFSRAWLCGFGWILVGSAGQLLKRSIFDICVWDAARLLFEANPTLGPGLIQAPRLVSIHEGGAA